MWFVKELVRTRYYGTPDDQIAEELASIAERLETARERLGELAGTIRAALPTGPKPQYLSDDRMLVCSDMAGDLGSQLLYLMTEAYLTPLMRETMESGRLLEDRLTNILTTHSGSK